MPAIKAKCQLWYAKHSRLLSGLQFAVLVLVISAASGLAAASLIRIVYVEQITDLKVLHARELTKLDAISQERLAEKDAVIASREKLLSDLSAHLAENAGKP